MSEGVFFADRFAELQQTQGNDVAIVFEDRNITFGDLISRSWQVGNGLLEMGIPRQERIAHLGKNSPEFFELFIAGCASAHALAGINWRLAGPEVEQILNYTENSVLFVDREFYPTIEAIEGNLTHIKHIIALDGGHERWLDYAQWRDAQADTRPDVTINGDDDILHLYTSGTTGLPKGVQLTNQGYLDVFNAFTSDGIFDIDQSSVFINVMPLFHVGGVNPTVMPLLCGAKFHLLTDFEPTKVLDTLADEGITNALFVPAMIQMLLQEPNVRNRDYSKLEYIYYGASPISESVLTEALEVFGCKFIQLYGATENYGLATKLPPEVHVPGSEKLRSCGRAVKGLTIKIVDGDGNEVPTGEVGEIMIQCDWLLKSYWKKPEESAEVTAGGWYHSGDAASVDEEGFVYIKDRVKDMIITGGENVFPAEVENALQSHPDIIDVAVIGVPDDKWGEAIVAAVVLSPGAILSETELIDYARTRVAGFKVPKGINFIDALPRNPSGKILRRELRAPYWEGKTRGV